MKHAVKPEARVGREGRRREMDMEIGTLKPDETKGTASRSPVRAARVQALLWAIDAMPAGSGCGDSGELIPVGRLLDWIGHVYLRSSVTGWIGILDGVLEDLVADGEITVEADIGDLLVRRVTDAG